MLWAYQKIRKLRKALCGKDTPRQMAVGLAFGLLLGLMPKGNLLALFIATALLSTRMSLATGMLCAFLVSLIAPFCDPLTHRIGQWVLTNGALVPLWQSLARLPFAAWTSFNNTVVMGNLALGTLLMYPVYRLSLPWMERLQRRYGETTGATSKAAPIAASASGSVETIASTSAAARQTEVDPLHLIPRRARPGRQRRCA